jgi:hypothetical protein
MEEQKDRPQREIPLYLYLPAGGAVIHHVHAGSAIVSSSPGSGDPDERIVVYFEGNIYGGDALRRFADRVLHAADRLIQDYPTVATAVFRRGELFEVAYFHVGRGEIVFHDPGCAARTGVWCAEWDGEPPEDQRFTSTALRRRSQEEAIQKASGGNPALAAALRRRLKMPNP